MTRRFVTALVAGVVLALALAGHLPAQGEFRVLDQGAEYRFGEELRFRLGAESDSPIKDVLLFYEFSHGEAVNRRSPEFTPGTSITVEHVERLQRGEIPPAVEIRYYWRLTNAAGDTFKTEPQSFLYMDDRFDFQQLSEGQVAVYWYSGGDRMGRQVLESALRSLARLEDTVGVTLDRPIKLVVYASKADMQEALPRRGSVFEARVTTLGTVVAPDVVLLLGQQEDLDATIAHELTHVVVGLATESPFSQVPAWLNEGLAMYNEMEGELRAGNLAALHSAVRRDALISVRSLTAPTGKPEEVNLWYGEAFSVVKFLLDNYGKEKMVELLAVLKRGSTTDDALMEVYGFDQDGLDALWRESLGLAPRQMPARATPAPTEEAEPPPSPVPPERSDGLCGGLLPVGALAALGLIGSRRLRRRRCNALPKCVAPQHKTTGSGIGTA